jgi:hypothetical protein
MKVSFFHEFADQSINLQIREQKYDFHNYTLNNVRSPMSNVTVALMQCNFIKNKNFELIKVSISNRNESGFQIK